jgi:hypothetical protein
MRHRLLMLALVPALVLAVAACGGSSKKGPAPAPTPTSAPKDEKPFAKSMLLELSDLPSGWAQTGQASANEDSPLEQLCGASQAEGRTGRAEGPDFAPGDQTVSVSESVLVFNTAEHAVAAIDKVPDLIDCATGAFNDGKLDDAGVEFSDATAKAVSVDAPGDKTRTYRIKVEGQLAGQPDSRQTVYILALYAIKGRVGYSLTVQSSDEAPDPDTLAEVATTAAAKIKQQP